MKIKLVFYDWHEKGRPCYPQDAHKLSTGTFHPGSNFDANIHLDAWQEKELRDAIKKGYQPVFWVF